jgi:hypothetical protein
MNRTEGILVALRLPKELKDFNLQGLKLHLNDDSEIRAEAKRALPLQWVHFSLASALR